MGDEELSLILSDEFLADVPKQIEALRRFLDTGDAVGALRQVHSIKGASATARTKPATLETGLIVHVPEYLGQGEQIKVDTRTGEYLSRA